MSPELFYLCASTNGEYWKIEPAVLKTENCIRQEFYFHPQHPLRETNIEYLLVFEAWLRGQGVPAGPLAYLPLRYKGCGTRSHKRWCSPAFPLSEKLMFLA